MPWIYTQDVIAERYGLDPRTIEPDDDTWLDYIGRLNAMLMLREGMKKNSLAPKDE